MYQPTFSGVDGLDLNPLRAAGGFRGNWTGMRDRLPPVVDQHCNIGLGREIQIKPVLQVVIRNVRVH